MYVGLRCVMAGLALTGAPFYISDLFVDLFVDRRQHILRTCIAHPAFLRPQPTYLYFRYVVSAISEPPQLGSSSSSSSYYCYYYSY